MQYSLAILYLSLVPNVVPKAIKHSGVFFALEIDPCVAGMRDAGTRGSTGLCILTYRRQMMTEGAA